MRNIIRVELLVAILLLSFSSGMPSAIAGTNPLVSPKILKVPAVKTLPAVAQQYHYQAVARTKVLKSGQVRAGGLSWQCQGSVCKISGPWPTPAVSACKSLASQIGAIRSYGYSGHMLSAAQLKQCNAGIVEQARKPVAKGARQRVPAPVLAAPVAPAGSKKSQPKRFTPPSAPRIEHPKIISPTDITGVVAPTDITGVISPTDITGVVSPTNLPPSALHIEQRKITAPQGGVAKSLTGPGGKSPLPPQTNERKVLIDDDTSPPPRLGGFVPGFVPPQAADEIRRAPVTGPGGQPLTLGYHLTATVEILDEGGRVLREVERGQHIQVRLTLRNTGDRPSPRYKIISWHGEFGPNDGLTPGDMYQKSFRDVVNEDRMSGHYEVWFGGKFRVRSTDGEELIRSSAGEYVELIFPVRSVGVAGIEGVRLTETWNEGGSGSPGYGNTHPVFLDTTVKIRNNGLQNSPPLTMRVSLESTRAGRTQYTGSGEYERVGGSGSIPMAQDVAIPALSPGQTRSFPVRFSPIPYIVEYGRRRRERAISGPYACGRNAGTVWEVIASEAKISVTVQTPGIQTQEDGVLVLNNGLTKEGKFTSVPSAGDPVTCGFE